MHKLYYAMQLKKREEVVINSHSFWPRAFM